MSAIISYSIPFHSIQCNAIQFNAIQCNSIQFISVISGRISIHMTRHRRLVCYQSRTEDVTYGLMVMIVSDTKVDKTRNSNSAVVINDPRSLCL
jgi:hypothetical protein